MKRSLIALVVVVFSLSSTVYAQKPQPPPCAHDITDCAEEGCGGQHDPELNKQKNIRSDDQDPVLQTIAWMKALPDPTHFTADNRNRDSVANFLGSIEDGTRGPRVGNSRSSACREGFEARIPRHTWP